MARLPNPRHYVTQRSWEFEAKNERGRDEIYYITEQIGPGDKHEILDVHGYSSRPGEKHIQRILDQFKRAVKLN